MTKIYEASISVYASVLEGTDPEKLRDILTEDIEFYSEASKKAINNLDEYIDWTRYVQSGVKKVFATKITITETPASSRFPAGSRCLVLSYGKKRDFSDIVFFDFSTQGKIKQIYISKGIGYKYVLDRLPGVPTDAEIEVHIKALMTSAAGKDSVDEYIKEQEDNYSRDLSDFAFREAIRQGVVSYIEDHADDFDLNDEDGSSSYLHESDDPEIQELLMDHGAFRSWDDYDDCRFAVETVNGTILIFDEDFQKEVFQKYLETYNLSKEDVIAMFEDEDKAESFDDEHECCFSDDMDALGVSIEDDEIIFTDKTDSEAGDLPELLEELGWECEFEGDRWKLETLGVYFIR